MASKTAKPERQRIPRDKQNDYSKDLAARRRTFGPESADPTKPRDGPTTMLSIPVSFLSQHSF